MLMDKRVELSKTYLIAAGLVTLLVGFVLGTRSDQIFAVVGPIIGIKTSTATLDDTKLQSTYRTLSAYFNGKLDENKLLEGAQRGLVEAAGDDYTVFMNRKEAEEFNKDLSGDIGGGIGAEIGIRNNQPTVVRTLPDNPAEKAGVHAGDVIIAVNDESTDGWNAEKTVTRIKGDSGTTVKLVVRRGVGTKEFNITRAIINNPSVSSELKGNVGIITLTRFDQETVSLVRKAVDRLKTQGMSKLVLDMRGNGGGYLDAAPGVAGMWLKDKNVVSIKATGESSQRLQSEGDQSLKGIKTAVLVNAGTASAAEIVTAALKYYDAATIVGEKTFGKGTVQELVPLADGAMLKVTIKRWYTPANTNVNGKGIKPDVPVGLIQADLDAGKDPQLEAALKAVNA